MQKEEVFKSEGSPKSEEVLRLEGSESVVLKSEVLSKSEDTFKVEDLAEGPQVEGVLKTEVFETELTCKSEPITDEQMSSENATGSDKLHSENMHYEGDVAIYTDPSTKHQFTWCSEKKEWVLRSNVVYGFVGDTHTYTDATGASYFWDNKGNTWIPKHKDEFMTSHGFVVNIEPKKEREEEAADEATVSQAHKHKLPYLESTWFDIEDKHNASIYVSNLPSELTAEEFVNFVQTCGLLKSDSTSGKITIELYMDSETKVFNGDALCTFASVESVDLALKVLDGSNLKGNKIKVERAKFQTKEEFDSNLKFKMHKKKDKEKYSQEKLLDWKQEKLRGDRAKHKRVVIVRNLYQSALLFNESAGLAFEYQQDLREEASKCGEVKKIVLYDKHPEGIVQITMKEPEAAEAVVKLLNGRWFGRRQLIAEIWDGITIKYRAAEADSKISQMLKRIDKYLADETKNDEIIDEKMFWT